jgi:hypothetical protein
MKNFTRRSNTPGKLPLPRRDRQVRRVKSGAYGMGIELKPPGAARRGRRCSTRYSSFTRRTRRDRLTG